MNAPAVLRNTDAPDDHPVVFFDGVCGFCNHTVNFLIARDRQHRLRFAPLQGQTARKQLPESLVAGLDTLVFAHNGDTAVRSAAVVRILRTIGGVWSIAALLLWLIPRPLRDLGYRGFARFRYRLFGRHEACRLPTSEERRLFLD